MSENLSFQFIDLFYLGLRLSASLQTSTSSECFKIILILIDLLHEHRNKGRPLTKNQLVLRFSEHPLLKKKKRDPDACFFQSKKIIDFVLAREGIEKKSYISCFMKV